jgi:hypothetical protein
MDAPVARFENPVLDRVIDPQFAFLFVDPPLLTDDDHDEYDELLAQALLEVKPKSLTEHVLIRDYVNYDFSAQRYKRIRASLVRVAEIDFLREFLKTVLRRSPFIEDIQKAVELRVDAERREVNVNQTAESLANAYFRGIDPEKTRAAKLLSQYRLDLDNIRPKAILEKLSDFERLDRMILSEEKRRDAVLREIERQRAAEAAKLRPPVEDAVLVGPSGQSGAR